MENTKTQPTKLPTRPARIQALIDIITEPYPLIWDTCCDHGLIGEGMLQASRAESVTFVDQVESITRSLQQRLSAVDALRDRWDVQTLDAHAIKLQGEQRQLLIIAGVSGKTCIDILKRIVEQNNPQTLALTNFLLCPNYYLYELREFLRSSGFQQRRESVVTQGKRVNEILLVHLGSDDHAIHEVGTAWDTQNPHHQCHLQKLAQHHAQKAALEHCTVAKEAAKAYRQLLSQSRSTKIDERA